MGELLSYDPASHRKAESLLRDGIGRLAPLVAREPEWERAHVALASCHGGLANLLSGERRYAEAAREWEQVVAMSKPDEKLQHKFMLALALARTGEHQKAWKVVEELRPSLGNRPAVYHFHLAVVCSLCAGAAEKDPGLSANDRPAACEKYGRAGVEIQRDALQLLPIAKRPAAIVAQQTDPDMAPLRRRADFQALSTTKSPTGAINSGAASAPRGSK